MSTVVVTGAMGSGKSTLCALLGEKGIPVYDSDSMAKSLYDRSEELRAVVVAIFGEKVLDAEGKIDRKALAAEVFSSSEKLSMLEAVVHPLVYRDFASWTSEQEETPFVVFESALFLSRKFPEDFADDVVLVDAPSAVAAQRASERDGVPLERIMERLARQSFRRDDPSVTYVVENDGTLQQLSAKADILYEYLKKKYNENRSR